jgi:hypothetical protein
MWHWFWGPNVLKDHGSFSCTASGTSHPTSTRISNNTIVGTSNQNYSTLKSQWILISLRFQSWIILTATLYVTPFYHSGFGGLVVSIMASGTQDHGFEPGQSRQIFQGRQSRITDLWHVKEPFIWCGTRQMMAKFVGHFSPIIPSFTNRGLSSLGMEHLWRWRAELQRRCTEGLQLIGLSATGW